MVRVDCMVKSGTLNVISKVFVEASIMPLLLEISDRNLKKDKKNAMALHCINYRGKLSQFHKRNFMWLVLHKTKETMG